MDARLYSKSEVEGHIRKSQRDTWEMAVKFIRDSADGAESKLGLVEGNPQVIAVIRGEIRAMRIVADNMENLMEETEGVRVN